MLTTIHQSRSPSCRHRHADGIALVVTLTMLAIISMLAVAFVLTARTEVKSGAAFNDQAAAKSLAKMAIDRAIMEVARQAAGDIVSGGEVVMGDTNSAWQAFISNYSTNDFTKMDNYTNDTSLFNHGTDAIGVSMPYRSPPGYDFVELDGQTGRSMIEPYWISVRSTDGTLRGRFAYLGLGCLVDLNAVGNIASSNTAGTTGIAKKDFYMRPADTNFGYGYLGVSNSTGYTRGICADISLQRFLEKLGYADPTNAARCILWYRYGWNPATGISPVAGVGGTRVYPGDPAGQDNNGDGFNNNPTEYTAYPYPRGVNKALTSLSSIWSIPIDNSSNWSATAAGTYDLAYSNLPSYAWVGPSADPNIVSPYAGLRVNLNAMTNGTAAIVANSVMQLTNVLMRFPQFTNNSIQVALNLIDFHTTNRYPTTFVSGTRTYAGIKPTPYINQILIRYDTTFYRSTNVGGAINKTNYWFRTSVSVTNEIWNPYPGTFPDTNNLVVTNVAVIFTNTTAAQPVRVGWKVSCLFSSPASGFTTNGISPSINTNVYYSTALGFTNMLSTGYYSNWPTAAAVPGNIIISNIFMQATLCGSNSVSETNLIQQITTPVTNVLAIPWPAYANWNTAPWLAGGAGKTNSTAVTSTIISLEADDPRLGILYNQTLGGPTYTLGAQNTTCSPTAPNPIFFTDTGNREGLASFYYRTNSLLIAGAILTNSYITIGDIGYVHRGEPWATIRLQPYGVYPYGDGGLLDYFRVSELADVAGRININSPIDGPLGVCQSPAFFALFSGITNKYYASPRYAIDSAGDSKILKIIEDIGKYRATQSASIGGTLGYIVGTNGTLQYIGQMCAIPSLTSDLSGTPIPFTDDANRELLIRAISNLITTWQGGGVHYIAGWGQVVKGGGTTWGDNSNGVPGQIVKMLATFQKIGGKIQITSYQYIP
jgi:hypothetical protein